MSASQIKTLSFSLYGDGSTTNWSVDLSTYAPAGFSVEQVYATAMVNIPYWGNYPQVTNLTYSINNSILTVTLPVAPQVWVPTSVDPTYVPNPSTPPTETTTPQPVTFNVTVSY